MIVGQRAFTGPQSLNGLSAKVAEKLPLAKDLPTIPDVEGNYDIDGVSYDSEGVIVSSDENKRPSLPVH